MAKNIIVGIGGTGLTAIRELRRLIAERYEGGVADPAVKSVRFVYIDTDREDARRRSNWTVLGKDISLQPGEKVEVTGDKLGPIVQRPKDFTDVAEWLPPIADFVGDPGEGAKGIRPYGRLIYEYPENKRAIQEAIFHACSSLNAALPHDPAWRIYIICSLSGGTGSGMFLPLADDLIKWKIFSRGVADQKMRAFLVLPPLQVTGRHDRYHANAFAALKELNHRGVSADLPFSNTYLVEPVTDSNLDVGLDNLPFYVAQRIFLNIQGGEAAARIDGLMDNPNLGDLENADSRHRHALCFSTFGLASISYSRETIARSISLQWASDIVASWLEERNAPQNVNQIVRGDLARLKLSRPHVNGDADPFGKQDFPPFEIELPRIADAHIAPLQKRELSEQGRRIRDEIENGFRQVGIAPFYQQREKDVRNAAEFAVTQVRLGVSREIRDPNRGIRYAKQYLEELVKILETEMKPEIATKTGAQAQRRVEMFQRNYGETVNNVAQHEQKLMYFDADFTRDKANMGDELTDYVVNVAGAWSGKYASSLLDLVIPALRQLAAELDIWHATMTELWGKLRGKLQTAMKGRSDYARENGTLIFNETVLHKIAREASAEVVNSAIEGRLRRRLGELEERELDDLDLFQLGKRLDADALIEAVAFQFILSAESPVNVQRTTLFDRFIADNPAPQARRELLERHLRLSGLFARSTPEEIARRPLAPTTVQVVSIPDVVGRVTRDNVEAQMVIRADLDSIGIDAQDVQATQDVERIIFINEKQGFPIRLIESVKDLKKYYDRFPARDALHIDKRQTGCLHELFLISDQEREQLEATEEAFVLARAQGWLAQQRNQLSGKTEIRCEYELPGKIGKRVATIGVGWEGAFERFTQDAIDASAANAPLQEARAQMLWRSKEVLISAKTDPVLWQRIVGSMTQMLDETAMDYKAHHDDPAYQRDRDIINRLVERQQD